MKTSEETPLFDVTVVIPSYRGQDHIRDCLTSLVAQTLDRTRFEVSIVVNGKPDEVARIADDIFGAAAGFNYSVLFETTASASHARNVGVESAQGSWVTWIDTDDWVSPNYLQALLSVAKQGVVPVAGILDVAEDTLDQTESIIGKQVLGLPPGIHSPSKLWRPLTFMACKLLPKQLVVRHKFDTELRNGEDVAYFGPVFARYGLTLDNTPAHEGATYYRLVRQGSVSRQAISFQFNVLDRLAVMRHLDEAIRDDSSDMSKIMRSMMDSQASFSRKYLEAFPDELPRVVNEYQQSGLSYIPWMAMRAPSNRLLISYNYPPFNDPSAITAAKRAYLSGVQWNVVSQDMSKVRSRDEQLISLTGPATSMHEIVPGAASFANWNGVATFCNAGMQAIDRIVAAQGPQSEVYSRAMWPASHFLAALHVLRATGKVQWRAEFSDPLRHDVHGRDRLGAVVRDALWDELAEGLAARGYPLPATDSLFGWAEWLPFCLADELVFTNPLQRATMMSGIGDVKIVKRVRERSSIQQQPTLPEGFYRAYPEKLDLESNVVNIGYFGSFYANRGLGPALSALALLPPNERSAFRIHAFSAQHAEVRKYAIEVGVGELIRTHEPLPYLSHLNAASQMSALLVIDADTMGDGHHYNPFLPSKLSDYLGAGVPILALSEPGSMLSGLATRYSARLNDIEATNRAFGRLREDMLR